MKKMNPKAPATRPISKKIIAGLRKASSRKVIDISQIRDAKIHVEDLEKTVITEKEIKDTSITKTT